MDFELTQEDQEHLEKESKFECPVCGSPLRGTEKFCGNCGIQLPS